MSYIEFPNNQGPDVVADLAEQLEEQVVAADPRVSVRLVGLSLLGLEVLEHAGRPVVRVKVNEGAELCTSRPQLPSKFEQVCSWVYSNSNLLDQIAPNGQKLKTCLNSEHT